MLKNWEEIIQTTLRNRRSVWIDNGWDVNVDDMLKYMKEKYEEYWWFIEKEKIKNDRLINIFIQLQKMAEVYFEKVSKLLDNEYGPSRYVKK